MALNWERWEETYDHNDCVRAAGELAAVRGGTYFIEYDGGYDSLRFVPKDTPHVSRDLGLHDDPDEAKECAEHHARREGVL